MRSPRLVVPAVLSLVLFSGEQALAQIAPGDLVVLTSGSGQTLFSLPSGGGAPTAVTGFTPDVIDNATSIEVEPTSGDLLLAVVGSGGSELWRAALSGLMVQSETLLAVLPDTAGMPLIDTHLEIDTTGTPTGCLLVLSHLFNNPLGVSPNAVIHRVSIGADAAVAVEIPFSYPGATPPEVLSAITSDPSGTIYLPFAQPGQPFPHASGVYSLPAAGGTLTTVYSGLPISARSVGVDLTGIAVAGGLGNLPVPPSSPNYWCGTAGVLIAPTTSPFTSPINDIHLDAGGATYTVSVNGVVLGAAGLGHLRRIPTGSCSAGAVTVIADFADAIVKVGQSIPSSRYGCGCVGSNGVTPLFSEITPPTPGGTWTTTLSGVAPGAPTVLMLGLNNVSWLGIPLPLDLSIVGAPGCVVLTSGQTLTLTTTASGAGGATFSFGVPATVPPGVPLFSQCYTIDGASVNPLPIATSNAVRSST